MGAHDFIVSWSPPFPMPGTHDPKKARTALRTASARYDLQQFRAARVDAAFAAMITSKFLDQ